MPCENSARRRSKTMALRCTPEEYRLIADMAAWGGMSRQDYILAKLTDVQVVVKPSVGVQKTLKDSRWHTCQGSGVWRPPTAS